jgi:hypothetical protein
MENSTACFWPYRLGHAPQWVAMVWVLALLGLGCPSQAQTPDINYPQANGAVYAIVQDSDGNTYLGGAFTSIGGVTRNRLAKIAADGTLDESWNPDANGRVLDLVVDGTDVYAAGEFISVGGVTRNHLAKIGTDGTLDMAWNPNANGNVWALAVEGTNVYVGGDFSAIAGTSRNYVAKVGTDGTLDMAWDPNPNNFVRALAADASGAYIGGLFTAVGVEARGYAAKVGTDGTLDAAWNPNANNTVWVLVVEGSTVYAGGQFSSFGGETRRFVARVGTDGTLDAAWNPNANNPIYGIAVDGNTVYIGGFFNNIGGIPRSCIASIDADGTASSNWNANSNNTVWALLVDGASVYAGGEYTEIGGVATGYVAVLPTVAPRATISTTAGSMVSGPFVINIAFTEDVSGLLPMELNITNASFSNAQIIDASNYRLTLNPRGAGDITVSIPAGVAQSMGGRGNDASNALIVNLMDRCIPNPTANLDYEWIQRFTVQEGAAAIFNNESGNNSGYVNFDGMGAIVLQRGATYRAIIVPGFDGSGPYLETYRIWIDYNRSGSLSDNADEMAVNRNGHTGITRQYFTVPVNASLGLARMRVQMKYFDGQFGGPIFSPCETFSGGGEVEDYLVQIVEPAGLQAARTAQGLAKNAEQAGQELAAYPNPASDLVQVRFAEGGAVALVSLDGRVLQEATASNGQASFDVSGLPRGLYLVIGTDASGLRQTVKLAVE